MARGASRKKDRQAVALREALDAGRTSDAWEIARGLMSVRGQSTATQNLCAIAAFQAGHIETAEDLLRTAVSRAPKNAEFLMNLGNVLAARDADDEAMSWYKAAHDVNKNYAEPAFNCGLSLARLGRPSEAASWFDEALLRAPDHTAAALARAEACREAGRLVDAKEALQILLAREPKNPVALANLSAVLSALNDEDAARKAAEKAVALDPGLVAAQFNLAVLEQSAEELDAAEQRYRRCLGLEAGHAAAALNLGECLRAADKREEAARAYERALDIDPTFAKALIGLADLKLEHGDAEAAQALVEAFQSRFPGEASTLAYLAFLLRERGNLDAAARLDDPARFLDVSDIVAPEGHATVDAFNQALVAHVLSHPSLTPSPAHHATRAGRHTGNLLDHAPGPFADLADLIMAGFETYKRKVADQPSHPFVARVPDRVRLHIWSVVMGRDGHQVPHIHPAAWLSGVYYPQIPGTISGNDPDQVGWIEFGRPPADYAFQFEPAVATICPKAGRMILFPSHLYHRTVPYLGDESRVSIAFDIVKYD